MKPLLVFRSKTFCYTAALQNVSSLLLRCTKRVNYQTSAYISKQN